jgi:hypothetical protein
MLVLLAELGKRVQVADPEVMPKLALVMSKSWRNEIGWFIGLKRIGGLGGNESSSWKGRSKDCDG